MRRWIALGSLVVASMLAATARAQPCTRAADCRVPFSARDISYCNLATHTCVMQSKACHPHAQIRLADGSLMDNLCAPLIEPASDADAGAGKDTSPCLYSDKICAAAGCNVEACDPTDGVCKVLVKDIPNCGNSGFACRNSTDGCTVDRCSYSHCKRGSQLFNCDRSETIACADHNPSSCQTANACSASEGCTYQPLQVECPEPADPCAEEAVRDGTVDGCCSKRPKNCAAEFGDDPNYVYACKVVAGRGVCSAEPRFMQDAATPASSDDAGADAGASGTSDAGAMAGMDAGARPDASVTPPRDAGATMDAGASQEDAGPGSSSKDGCSLAARSSAWPLVLLALLAWRRRRRFFVG